MRFKCDAAAHRVPGPRVRRDRPGRRHQDGPALLDPGRHAGRQVSIYLNKPFPPAYQASQRGKPVRKVATLTPTFLHGVHLFL